MEIEASYVCAYCFQVNEITVDGSGGLRQKYIEDCQVCCKPNNLIIVIDDEMTNADIHAEVA